MSSVVLSPSVVECVFRHAEATPDKAALVINDVIISYRQLMEATCAFAALLETRGVGAGDRVVLKAQHTLSYVAAYLGTTLLSAVAVPHETDLPQEGIDDLCRRVEASCIFGSAPSQGIGHIPDSWLDEAAGIGVREGFPCADDLAELLLTTGTTGTSKVVAISHRAIMAVEENIITATGIESDNVSLVPMPLNHVFALRRLQAGLVMGATVVLIPGVASLKKVFGALSQHHVTSLSLVPSALAYLHQTTKDYLGGFDGQIRYIESSSAPLPTATRNWLRAILPHARLYNSYGCTESTACCMLEYSGRHDDGACVGAPCATATITIVDPDTNEPVEGSGRVTIGGTGVMDGYWGDEQATSETLRNGAVLTNDLGYLQDGELYVLGRIDDVAIIGGHNVSPSEVDDVIVQCAVVAECACVRGHDQVTGDRLVLFVVWEQDADAGAATDELQDYLRTHLEAHKIPSEIRVIDRIPRTYNGKVDRKVLQALVSAS